MDKQALYDEARKKLREALDAINSLAILEQENEVIHEKLTSDTDDIDFLLSFYEMNDESRRYYYGKMDN